MTIMSPGTCSQCLGVKPPCSHLHAQELYLPVILIVDRVVQHSPFQFHAFAYTVQVILKAPSCHSDRMQCMHMTITLRVQNLTLLTEMITPQIYIQEVYMHIKPSCVFGACSGLP